MRLRIAIVAVIAMLYGRPAPRCGFAAEPTAEETFASLETRLKKGLQARLPGENAFVDAVVEQVNAGRLPRKLVDSTYLWAVQRRQSYPFPCFQRALRIQAARLGLDL